MLASQGGRRKIDSGRARDAGSCGTAFVSLSGEAPSDEEWAAGTARSRSASKRVPQWGPRFETHGVVPYFKTTPTP